MENTTHYKIFSSNSYYFKRMVKVEPNLSKKNKYWIGFAKWKKKIINIRISSIERKNKENIWHVI